MHYMHTRGNPENASSTGKNINDPLTILMGKLIGVNFKMPRMKTGYNMWGPQHRAEVDPIFKQRVEAANLPKSQHIALRSAVYKELFENLPADEQQLWTKAATREHEKAVQEIRKKMQGGISTEPEDRQK